MVVVAAIQIMGKLMAEMELLKNRIQAPAQREMVEPLLKTTGAEVVLVFQVMETPLAI